MPKLGELVYIGALAVGNEITAKVLHFIFGILTCIVIYKLTRRYYSKKIALIAVVIFYSNLVVAWESITAYIDLIRTFFEILSLSTFLNWYESKKNQLLILTAIFIGLAVSTKLIALGSLAIFVVLIIYLFKNKLAQIPYTIFVILILSFTIPLPWFVFSFLNTGNPMYPFFTNLYSASVPQIKIVNILHDLMSLFLYSSDPISPVYIILLPLVFILYPKLKPGLKIIALYSLLSLIIWYFTPRTGGGRFILPYLPAFSILCAALIDLLKNKWFVLRQIVLGTIIFVALVTLFYRGTANAKYLSVILGKETKENFLTNHLNFSYGDFYDTDNYFKNNITSKDTVLLYGFHNLYYVDFPFIDSSWVKNGDSFKYIATQNSQLPQRFKNWNLIYMNSKTLVKLYQAPKSESCYQICIY
jgi:4-amino-4-deoxy-L-arabinose transferase-like glycosyltransferase